MTVVIPDMDPTKPAEVNPMNIVEAILDHLSSMLDEFETSRASDWDPANLPAFLFELAMQMDDESIPWARAGDHFNVLEVDETDANEHDHNRERRPRNILDIFSQQKCTDRA